MALSPTQNSNFAVNLSNARPDPVVFCDTDPATLFTSGGTAKDRSRVWDLAAFG